MSYFFLIRNQCGVDREFYYGGKTDVWFFGDVPGYRTFLRRLRSAILAKSNLHLWALAKRECNMLLTVLPPIARASKQPRMMFWERLVFYQSKPWMELVVSGNVLGFRRFIYELELFLKEPTEDSSGHLHFDGQNGHQPWIEPGSVSLNLRGPLKKWNPVKLRENGHEKFLESKAPDTIPADLHYRLNKEGRPGKRNLPKYHEITRVETEWVWNTFGRRLIFRS